MFLRETYLPLQGIVLVVLGMVDDVVRLREYVAVRHGPPSEP